METQSDSIDLLVAYAFDLLAQTEAQHRKIQKTQTEIEAYIASRNTTPRSFVDQAHCLAAIKRRVSELTVHLREQRLVVFEMHQALTQLQRNGP